MKTTLWLCVAAGLLAGLPFSAAAQVYRCTIDGRVVYQDAPCLGLKGAIKLNPNAEPPQPMDQLRAKMRATTDKLQVQNREAAQARQDRIDAVRAEIAGIRSASRSASCESRLAHVQRVERTASERARQAYTGNRDTRWADLARSARQDYQADCR